MKVLFDQNLSPKLATSLQDLFPGSTHVIKLKLDDADEWEIWNHAASEGFVLASKDTDFRHRSLMQGHPPKVILVTTGNCTSTFLEGLFRQRYAELEKFEAHARMSIIELG